MAKRKEHVHEISESVAQRATSIQLGSRLFVAGPTPRPGLPSPLPTYDDLLARVEGQREQSSNDERWVIEAVVGPCSESELDLAIEAVAGAVAPVGGAVAAKPWGQREQPSNDERCQRAAEAMAWDATPAITQAGFLRLARSGQSDETGGTDA